MERAIRVRNLRRERKAKRIRRKVRGTAEKPRLSVHRSHKQIYVQAIDDRSGTTLASASSLDSELRAALQGPKAADAKAVGEAVARRLVERGVNRVVFDRGWYRYHGRIKAVADGAREGGLSF